MMSSVYSVADWDANPEVCGNVARRKLFIRKGAVLPPHDHFFSHGSLVTKGKVLLRLENPKTGEVKERTYSAGDFFEVPSKWLHSFTGIEESEVSCFFAVRDEDGGVAYEVTDSHRKDRFWHEGHVSG